MSLININIYRKNFIMNYSKCIIYKIKCKYETVPDQYVGHTFNLQKRTALHKSNCINPNRKEYNIKLYQIIRSNGGFENWTVEVIENYTECNILEDARKRERYYIEQLKANLNNNRPIITAEEKKEQMKQYYVNNSNKF